MSKSVCGFGIAWLAPCKHEVEAPGCRCSEHTDIKCASCGAPATHQCEETGGLVCGYPLCDECTHNTHPEGHNGLMCKWPDGMRMHCKKSERKYAPWYVDSSLLEDWKKQEGIPESVEIILTSDRNGDSN